MDQQPILDGELVPVFDTPQESEAMVVHGLLASAGIDSLITGLDVVQNIYPGLGGVVVRVNPAQAEQARQIIAEYTTSLTEDEDSDEDAEPNVT